jgi:hypothetical protein
MAQEETDAADVTLDLLAIQSSALEAILDYRRYLRNAENAGPADKAGQHGERPAGISACRT